MKTAACLLIHFVVICGSQRDTIAMKEPCPKGEYKFNSEECRRCPTGTFTDKSNNNTRCYRCRPCGQFAFVKRSCTRTHDTKCACNDGRYLDRGLDFCALCGDCGVGEGVSGRCKGRNNTKCEPCIEGKTFSNSTSSTDTCRPCRACKEGETVARACTKRNDTVCKPRPGNESELRSSPGTRSSTRLRFTTELPTTTTSEGSTSDTAESTGGSRPYLDVNLILAGVAGFLLVILLVGVVVLLRKKFRCSTNRSRNRDTASSTPRSGSSDSISAGGDPEAPHSDKLHCSPYAPEKYLRNVSYSLVSELSRHLNPEGRWKTLAGRLDFNTTDILNMNIKPDESTEAMLNRWGQRHDSTVNHLFDVLMSLGWKHEANLVRKYIYLP